MESHIFSSIPFCADRENFPIKDPFFAMSRRSLNTFMNALTGSDFTCYPAASQNEKDFYNLMDVYIDAVFHPQLKQLAFLQEGHRFEFTDPKNPKSPLSIKGIVFNEMKGSLWFCRFPSVACFDGRTGPRSSLMPIIQAAIQSHPRTDLCGIDRFP